MYTCKFLLELPQRKRTRPLYLGLFLIIKVELEIKGAAINKNDSTFLLHGKNKACKDLVVLQAILVSAL